MIGIIIVTHGELARAFVRATEMILGTQDQLRAIEMRADEDVDVTKTRLAEAVKEADQGDGVVILTDMFGGTPSNLALTFHAEAKVEVLMGVNLPMLLKLVSSRAGTEGEAEKEKLSLAQLVSMIAEYGRKNIQVATDILRKKPSA